MFKSSCSPSLPFFLLLQQPKATPPWTPRVSSLPDAVQRSPNDLPRQELRQEPLKLLPISFSPSPRSSCRSKRFCLHGRRVNKLDFAVDFPLSAELAGIDHRRRRRRRAASRHRPSSGQDHRLPSPRRGSRRHRGALQHFSSIFGASYGAHDLAEPPLPPPLVPGHIPDRR